MTNTIDRFDGNFRFLSNFWLCMVTAPDGLLYGSVEHGYQAMKTEIESERTAIRLASSAAEAKALGRAVTKRANWEEIKLSVMEHLLREKFMRHPSLKAKLIDTSDAILIEGNHWNDTYWGVCRGRGENHLGKLLMKIREELTDERNSAGVV